jgi:predicted O-linked N-acetylglucosamine transferase (SPINDLY family)
MQFNLVANLFQTAYAHLNARRLAEAEDTCRQALQIDPRHASSLYLMATIMSEAGRPAESLGFLDQALALGPNVAEAHGNRGIALMTLGRLDEAEQALRRAIELDPKRAEPWYALGNLKAQQKQQAAAFEAFLQAVQIDPRDARSWANMGIALQQMGKLDDALAAYDRARSLLPNEAMIYYNTGIALHGQGRVLDAMSFNMRALELDPHYVLAHSNLLLDMLYVPGSSAAELLEAHRAWDHAHVPVDRPKRMEASGEDPERRLRIGYVSGDFRQHPVGWLLANVLPAHDRSQVDVFCYCNEATADDVTARLQESADHWRDIVGQSDQQVAAQVRKDGIDILVDLSGHTSHNRLLTFAKAPAPVQVSWIGYPSTTGLAAMDYLVMDAATVPPGSEAWCSEAVVRLPHGRFCYAAPLDAPPVAERPQGPVTFGSFNHLAKVSEDVVRVWARVLHAVPGSRLVLKWKSLDEPPVRELLAAGFAAQGIDADRLELRGPSSHADMLAEYADIDIALDPFPYTGGITSAEALWMGVPVVTWPQDRIASRQTLAFLTELGLTDLAAETEEDYVRIAAALAGDVERRGDLRRTLRPRMQASPMTDGARFTPGLEAAYRQMWRRWCAGQAPEAITIAASA